MVIGWIIDCILLYDIIYIVRGDDILRLWCIFIYASICVKYLLFFYKDSTTKRYFFINISVYVYDSSLIIYAGIVIFKSNSLDRQTFGK